MADEKETLENAGKRNENHNFSSGIFWGVLFIYAGFLFFLVNWNIIYGDEWFAYFLLGLGLFMIGDFLLRQFVDSLSKSGLAKLIFGLIFLIVGANNIFYLGDWWPLILVFVGGFMVLSAFRKRQVHLS